MMGVRFMFHRFAVFALVLSSQGAFSSGSGTPPKTTSSSTPKDFFDLSQYPEVKVDMRYATSNNFLDENIYQDFRTPFLHVDTKAQFDKVITYLKRRKPGWKLLVFDALRPHSMQKKLWEKVVGTPEESYVMNPKYGSIHSYGFALDLSLEDESGNEVDMGTGFDSFLKLSQPRHEDQFLSEGKLTRKQVENRQLLREIMGAGDFKVIPNEWWHFEAKSGTLVRRSYSIYDR